MKNNMFEEFKNKVKEWGVKDWEMGSGGNEFMNIDGDDISKEEYFKMIDDCKNMYDLVMFYYNVNFEDNIESIGMWLDEVIKG